MWSIFYKCGGFSTTPVSRGPRSEPEPDPSSPARTAQQPGPEPSAAASIRAEHLCDVGLPEVLGPTGRVAGVRAVADGGIGPRREEHAHGFRVAVGCGQVERRDLGSPVAPSAVRVGSVTEQPFGRGSIAPLGGNVEEPGGRFPAATAPDEVG